MDVELHVENVSPIAKNESSAAVLQLISNMWAVQAAATFARLSGPDHLAAGPKSAHALAADMGVDADALARLLRGIARAGIVQRQGEAWALTATGNLLRRDVPGSMRAFLIVQMAPAHWLPWGQMDHSIRTGGPATHLTLGMDYWSYCKSHPEEGRDFAAAMTSLSTMAIEAVLAADDFTGARCVVDVGGSHGALLEAILARVPHARGVLFDLPHVVEGAGPALRAANLVDRVELCAGSFFESVPSGGDTYLLKHILHDWSDNECVTILGRIREVLPKDGRLVVVDMVLDEQGPPSPAALLDLNMLVMHTGRERTLSEFEVLFRRAGLRLFARKTTASPFVLLDVRTA
ncbi:SAM-dependent methyltransferase [Pendulispora brunnea]|uniref:SAM-dependent methyltransferase n=1 Tax=Pendulispora brunnea TaxID=2905690 RepID=A0ABZ2KHM8_9BACT